MLVQYSEKFPGICIDEKNEKIYVSKEKFEQELGGFFESFESGNIDYFKISENYASGFHEFKSQLPGRNIKGVKCQVTGPITFGMSVKDENGRSIYYDPTMRQVGEYNCIMKSIWQIKQISEIKNPKIILFLDEPYLAAYGSAFTAISREDIMTSIQGVITGIKSSFPNLRTGVHCCANTDWSILCETEGVDIISFDAYEFFDNLVLYTDALSKFIDRGGILAWGIVPTNEESIKKESAESLSARFKNSIDKLAAKGIDKKELTDHFLITPACGFGSRSESAAEKALELLSDFNSNVGQSF
jgi:methionine synthase II (cobalamin-independent)